MHMSPSGGPSDECVSLNDPYSTTLANNVVRLGYKMPGEEVVLTDGFCRFKRVGFVINCQSVESKVCDLITIWGIPLRDAARLRSD